MRICDPMLPALALHFNQPLAKVAPVVALFALAYGLMMIVFGPIGDRVGKLPVIAGSALLSAVATLACAAANSLDTLILARIACGAVTAAIVPLAYASIGDAVPFEQRQVTIAQVVSGVTLGVVFGQTLGGVLVDTVGWRYAFVVQALLFLIPGAVLAATVYRDGAAKPGRRPRSGIKQGIWQGIKHGVKPILADLIRGYRDIFTDPWARRILLTVAIEGFLCFGVLAFLPTMMHDRFSIPLWQAGLATALFGIGGFVYTILARALLARLGEQLLVRFGCCVLAGSLLGLVLAPNWPIAGLCCLAMGLGFYCQHNTLQAHGTQLVPARRGMAIACFACVYFCGQAIGVAQMSVLAPMAGFATVFLVVALALALLGASLERALKNHHR